MSRYSTAGDLRELERYVNRHKLTPKTVKNSLKEVAFLDKLQTKSKKKKGYTFEVSNRRLRTTDSFKSFLPWADATDFVGDDPNYTAGVAANFQSYTYTRKDPTRNMVIRMAFFHDEIRINEFEIDAADTVDEFTNLFGELADEMVDNWKQNLASQVLRGQGDGQEGTTNGSASDMYGLYNQVRHSSFSGNTANDTANVHFGLARHEFPHLVGRVFDASQVDTVSSTQLISIANCTCTNGSTQVTFSSTNLSTAAIGWMVRIKSGSTVIASGYEYRVGFLTASTGQTTLQMTQIFRGTTASTYTVELFPFFRDDMEGDAGTWNVNKLYKVLTSCLTNGKPDYGCVNSSGFYKFMAHLEAKQQWWKGEDAQLKQRGYDNFYFGPCVMTIDEHEDAGTVGFYDSKYTQLYWHRKYGMPKIKRNSLRYDTSGRRIGSLVGDMIQVGQLVVLSPANCGRVTGLPEY